MNPLGTGKPILLITGATGFIGSHVAGCFLGEGDWRVLAIVRRIENYKNTRELQKKGALLFRGAFDNAELLEQVFRTYPIHSVIHLAAVRGAGRGAQQDYLRVNVLGTERLLDASLRHGVEKFVFCSSVGVHGTIPARLPAAADSSFNGDNAYHASKIAAERKVKEYVERGLNALIVRPTVTYGAGDDGFPRNLVSLVRRRMFLLPAQENRIHLLSVSKFAELTRLMVGSGSTDQRVFIAADESPVSICELADLVHQHYHGTPYPSWLRMPKSIADSLCFAFRLVRNARWLVRMSLVYQSWYYDMTDTVRSFGYVPANTKDVFVKTMCV